ncbi:MAG: LuxR family transcriptional regulator [Alphaproteobacteria bacterium BRH_c36]|nr:MAG: LuxR family transcriptional regulator [Alphaproteobacteria bacterium BRH_c36]
MAEYRITIVDDHPLFRGALNQALSASMDATFQEAGSLDQLNEQLGLSRDVDLVLLDLNMPGVQGLSGLMFLRAQYPEIPVVVCSANEDPGTIRRCIEFGASGYIPKSQPIEQIREAVAKVLGGEVWTPPDVNLSGELDEETSDMLGRLSSLTPQQVRVLMMLGEGLLNKQIAYKLSVSEATIKAHVSAILQKLGVDSRTQAVIAISRIDNRDWQSAAN